MADSASKPSADWGNQTGTEAPTLNVKRIEQQIGEELHTSSTGLSPFTADPDQAQAAKAVADLITSTPGGREAFEKVRKAMVDDTLQGGPFTDRQIDGIKFTNAVAEDLKPPSTPPVDRAEPAKLPARP